MEVLKRWCADAVLLMLTVALASSGNAQQVHSEFEVKAAYLFRFADYIQWPDPPAVDHPFVIAVMGNSDIERALAKLQPGHLINQQVVQILDVTRVEQLQTVRVLYVGAGHDAFLRAVIGSEAQPLLIVTDEDQGLELGGMVNFVTIDNRVRFEVSLTAAERAHLKVSADLLSVAIRVNGGRRQSANPCPPVPLPDDDDAFCAIREYGLATRTPLESGSADVHDVY